MKKAIIFHGTDCKPEDYWYQWLGKQLESRGFSVEIPYYPDINHEPIATFLPKVLKAHTFDSETVIIGHSAGGPLLLSILENVEAVLPQAILVAGYAVWRPNPRHPEEEKDLILQDDYKWERINSHVKDIILINSDNDPWGCNSGQGRIILDKLGNGTQIIRKHDGHFGSDTFHQPYPEFPLLARLVK